VTTTKDLDALVAQVSAKEKMINILVNNAGMSGPKVPVADSAQAFKDSVWKGESQEEWKNTFDLNTSAVYFTSVAFAPLLEKAVSSTHKACIVNISSISGKLLLYMRICCSYPSKELQRNPKTISAITHQRLLASISHV